MKFFSAIGHFFKKVFTDPKAITLAAGIADIILPGFSPLINSAASAIVTAETSAAAAGMQSGTGTAKMETAIALFQDTYNKWAASNGLTQEPTAVRNILQNVFNLLNELQVVPTRNTSGYIDPSSTCSHFYWSGCSTIGIGDF